MPQKTIRQALKEALAQKMRRDPTIVVIGEDVSGLGSCRASILLARRPTPATEE